MKETWRWFGPQDPVSLNHVKQAGATGIVTALHHLYRGEVWPLEEILKRKAEIEVAGLVWSVVESIPVHNSIKLRTGPFRQYIDAWKDSVVAIAKAGIKIVCYNFMPVVDWVRTDLKYQLSTTGYALRFDVVDFAVYDLFILRRKDAEKDYSTERTVAAQVRFKSMSESRQRELEQTLIAGLPGCEGSYDRESIRILLKEYAGMTSADLLANLVSFLDEIVPVAQEVGLLLAIHPDDPPISLFGLPRVVSTGADMQAILNAYDAVNNGLTFCVGSYGARADNDLLSMIEKSADRIHFAHLRQVTRETDGSFYEAGHLDGTSDMVGVVYALLKEERHRRLSGRHDQEIPMRPDHGHLLANDQNQRANPGYALVGRLKGLAELRGVMRGLVHAIPELKT